MKVRTFLASLPLLAACATAVLAEDKPNPNDKNLFKEYMEKFGPPGPEHKLLDQLAGNWQASVKCWMDGGSAPKESDGTVTRKSIYGGRFISEEVYAKINDQPFTGFGTIGFDRAKKKYVTTWIDSMSTSPCIAYGKFDEATKTWTFTHNDVCPITGKPTKMRNTLRIISNDEEQMEMNVQVGDEKEMHMMSIHLTRKK